jgi:hypothetical protein
MKAMCIAHGDDDGAAIYTNAIDSADEWLSRLELKGSPHAEHSHNFQ